ncbi:MAG: hypothetical protein V3U89_00705 [Methylophilaceae bacterium]
MKKYNFALFTTCDSQGDRLNELLRLLDSVDHAVQQHRLSIKHYILLQRAENIPEQLTPRLSKDREFMMVNERLSLSRARNVMLNRAAQDATLENAEICAFPDDDAWYANGFLNEVSAFLMNEPNISVFSCRYGSTPIEIKHASDLQINPKPVNVGSFIQSVSSVTLFLKTKIALKNAFFDERLGVGAKINGGEDLDYALRSYTNSEAQVAMSRLKLVGHRDRVTWARSTYYSGSLFAIAKSARADKTIFFQLLRKIAVGFYFVLKRELKLADYLTGLKVGISGFFKQTLEVANFD